MQAFDRNSPLPEERLSLLFDIGAPSCKSMVSELVGFGGEAEADPTASYYVPGIPLNKHLRVFRVSVQGDELWLELPIDVQSSATAS
jgi:hypothetical protein